MMRRRTRYETAFGLTTMLLATGAAFAFSRIGVASRSGDELPVWRTSSVAVLPKLGAQSNVLTGARAIAATDEDYQRFAEEDAVWRKRHAQLPDLFLMKRRAMQERVWLLGRSKRGGAAIAELSRWTTTYPRDREALLWLARLLRDAGRTRESLATYRQLLTISEGAR